MILELKLKTQSNTPVHILTEKLLVSSKLIAYCKLYVNLNVVMNNN